MKKGRLEAFSDGVFAIIITILVLELRVPQGDDFSALRPLAAVFVSYVLSFLYVAIYWNNHHHLFQLVKQVNGPILWANTHLLFWLSLIPFVTTWSGENHFAAVPVALYGLVLFMAAVAYFILTKTLIAFQGKNSDLTKAIGTDFKGKISAVFYAVAIPLTLWSPYSALFFYVLVAALWMVPDRRDESREY
jgi:uncharacterized membrane protein